MINREIVLQAVKQAIGKSMRIELDGIDQDVTLEKLKIERTDFMDIVHLAKMKLGITTGQSMNALLWPRYFAQTKTVGDICGFIEGLMPQGVS